MSWISQKTFELYQLLKLKVRLRIRQFNETSLTRKPLYERLLIKGAGGPQSGDAQNRLFL